MLLSLSVAVALSVNLIGACSAADDDYDKYKGDELNTRATATRSVTETNINNLNATPDTVVNAPFTFANDEVHYGTFVYVISASKSFDSFSISVNDNDCESDTIGRITGEILSFTAPDNTVSEDYQIFTIELSFSTYLEKKKSKTGKFLKTVLIPRSDFK